MGSAAEIQSYFARGRFVEDPTLLEEDLWRIPIGKIRLHAHDNGKV